MPQVMEQNDVYRGEFDRLQQRPAADGQAWIAPLRAQALQAFLDKGFPTTRDEEWRFTSLKPITGNTFTLPEPSRRPPDLDDIARFALPAADIRLVFVDGHYQPSLSTDSTSIPGVMAMSLADALRSERDRVQHHLARHLDYRDDVFAALNTALFCDGGFVRIERGADIRHPIHLLFVSTIADGPKPAMTHPRNLIVAERDSRATVIEHYVTLADGLYWSNAASEVVVCPNAQLAHYLLEQDSEQAINISTLRVQQERDSRFESHTALFGGALVRNNIHAELAGSGAHSLINGLFLGHGSQHMDNHMRVVHAAEHCDSRQHYRGILGDKAHGVFCGRIVVNPGAQKTDAKQSNRNLLLSDDAKIDTKPQLEIYADDVKCTHGATTGQIDENALFYLQSRGLDADAARGMLIYAFARASLERMSFKPLRDLLERQLATRLPHAQLLQALIQTNELYPA